MDSQGKAAYVGFNSGKVVSFSYLSGEIDQRFEVHKAAVRSICMSTDDRCVVTASDDRTAKVSAACYSNEVFAAGMYNDNNNNHHNNFQ